MEVTTAHGEHKYVEHYTMYRIAQNVLNNFVG